MDTGMHAAPYDAGARVVLAGATGLVGQALLRHLMAAPSVGEVRALVRHEIGAAELLQLPPTAGMNALPGLAKLRIGEIAFDRLERQTNWFKVDWVCCALGTTMRQAGSQAAFRQVDFDYPLHIAQLAKAQGASRFLLVSALGANAHSRVFYNRVKGELEEAIQDIGFEHVSVAQPSFLQGKRAKPRLSEHFVGPLGFLLPERYKPVHAQQVAAGLLASGVTGAPGWHVLSNIDLRRIR